MPCRQSTRREREKHAPAMASFLPQCAAARTSCECRIGRRVRTSSEMKLGCVEADAGWVPPLHGWMDHAFQPPRSGFKHGQELVEAPSAVFAENIYGRSRTTGTATFRRPRELRRGSVGGTIPHSDSTWPWCENWLAKHGAISDAQSEAILQSNVSPSTRRDTRHPYEPSRANGWRLDRA